MRPPTPMHPDHGAASWLRPTRLQVERFPRVCTEGESNWMLRRAPLPADAASPVRFCRSGMFVPIRNVGNGVPRKSLPDHSRGGGWRIQRRCGDVAEKIHQRAGDLPPAANDPPTSVFAGTYLDFVLQLNFKERVGLVSTTDAQLPDCPSLSSRALQEIPNGAAFHLAAFAGCSGI